MRVFIVRHLYELPEVWQRQDQTFLATSALQVNLPVDKITSRVVFELPDCELSWGYHRWLSSKDFPDTIVGVAITNMQDFTAAHGHQAATDSMGSLRDFGHPLLLMRVVLLRDEAPTPPP